jgi:glycosyltransferase involved in cell wall biosynthesis
MSAFLERARRRLFDVAKRRAPWLREPYRRIRDAWQAFGDRAREPSPFISPAEYRRHLISFLERSSRSSADAVVLLYTTTKSIGNQQRSNRSMQMARVLAERGIPTLYSYWRWRPTEDCAAYEGGDLLQLPVDVTHASLARIASMHAGQRDKICLLSAPTREACSAIALFARHGWRVVYECRDDWEEFARAGQSKWFRRNFERWVVQKSDIVVAVSETLKEKLETYRAGRNFVHVVPNGYAKQFASDEVWRYVEQGRPEAARVIGYFGHLTPAWFDWALIQDTARRHPDWRFEIVGFGAPAGLRVPPNVTLLGPKTQSDIAVLARRWSVGIIPFVTGRLTEAVDPIKAYEYLALGLPIVAAYMPQLRDYPYTSCYRDEAQFASSIVRAMQTAVEPRVIRDFLRGRAWEDRVDQLLKLVRGVSGASPRRAREENHEGTVRLPVL